MSVFNGKLGYACINTYLREQKDPVFTSRTCRLAKIKKEGIQFAKELGMRNLADLKKIIQWNEENGIRFFRISSNLFPFASHPEVLYSLDFADKQLREIGDLAKKYCHRLTMHPGQYTVLSSTKESVNRNGALDLKYHSEILDRMGLAQDSVIVLHMGGSFGDKPAAIERFAENFKTLLPESCQKRLVLENDDMGSQGYTVEDLLPVCKRLGIPLVLDWHHDLVNKSSKPVSAYLDEIRDTWRTRNIKQKQHYSESKYSNAVLQSEKRAHSDRVCQLPPILLEEIPERRDIDLMIEAKDKEQAVFELYKIYNLAPVNEKYVLPPKDERKGSVSKRKIKDVTAEPETVPPAKKEFEQTIKKETTVRVKKEATRASSRLKQQK